MSSQCPPLLNMQSILPWIQPQPPTPPLVERQNQASNAPNTPIHRQNPQHGYEACWRRILECLNQSPGSLDAFIFLLELVEKSFRHFECLAVEEHYHLVVNHDGTALDLAMTEELWAELKSCRMRGHSNGLRSFLQRHQGLLSSPLRLNVARGRPTGLVPASPDQIRHRSSKWSPYRHRSRTPSFGSSASSDSGDCEREYWCPLVAQDYCKQKPFKKWGNARNHMMREHRWFCDKHPDWQSQLRPVDSLRSPTEPELQPCSPGEGDFGQLGTSFHSNNMPEQSFGGSSGSRPSPQHQARLLQRKPVPASVPWTSPAGLSSNSSMNQATVPNENQDMIMDDLFPSDEFAGSMMYINTVQLDPNSLYFGEIGAVNSNQQSSPTRASPWPGFQNQRATFEVYDTSGDANR